MELSLKIDRAGKMLNLTGEVLSYQITSLSKEIPLLDLIMSVSEYSISNDDTDKTQIIALPDKKAKGVMRVFGATSIYIFNCSDDKGSRRAEISLSIKSFHTTQEEAAAAEMEEIMKRTS
jgi:hypothetical protein